MLIFKSKIKPVTVLSTFLLVEGARHLGQFLGHKAFEMRQVFLKQSLLFFLDLFLMPSVVFHLFGVLFLLSLLLQPERE